MERLVVFEPGESGQRSALSVALHLQGLGYINRLVGEAAFVPRCLQGYRGLGRPKERGCRRSKDMSTL